MQSCSKIEREWQTTALILLSHRWNAEKTQTHSYRCKQRPFVVQTRFVTVSDFRLSQGAGRVYISYPDNSVAQVALMAHIAVIKARPKFLVAHLSTKTWAVSSWAMPASAAISVIAVPARFCSFSKSFLLMGCITKVLYGPAKGINIPAKAYSLNAKVRVGSWSDI